MLRCQAKHWCILLPLWLLMGNLVSWCCHEFVGVIIWCLGGQMKILGFIRLHKWFPHSSRAQFKVGLLLWSLDFVLLSCYIVTFVLSSEGPFRFFGHCSIFFWKEKKSVRIILWYCHNMQLYEKLLDLFHFSSLKSNIFRKSFFLYF